MRTIVAAKIQFSDGEQVRTLGVSDGQYDGDASGLEGGVWWPILDSNSRWGESARHPYQGQPGAFSVGDLELVWAKEILGNWPQYQLAGLITEVQRGPADATWNEEADRWDVHHPGKLEPVWRARGRTRRFEGNSRLILSYESILGVLSGALNTEVFDENTPNDKLVNRAAPMVLGQVYQVRPHLVHPQQLIHFCAWNLASVQEVREGGNITTLWEPGPQGFGLLASPQLPITAHFSGPPTTGEETEVDVLASIGTFSNFDTNDEPVGWEVFTETGKSSVGEFAVWSGLEVDATGEGDTDTGWKTATTVAQGVVGTAWEAVGAASLAASLVTNNDTEYAKSNPTYSASTRSLTGTNWEFGIPADSVITGIEIAFVSEEVSGDTYLTADIKKPGAGRRLSGAFQALTGKQSWSYGGNGNLLDLEWSVEDTENMRLTFGAFAGTRDTHEVRMHQAQIKVFYSAAIFSARIYADPAEVVLTPGRYYRMIIYHSGDNSCRVRWGAVNAVGDSLEGQRDAFSLFDTKLSGVGEFESTWLAQGEVLGLEFYRGPDSDGHQVIDKIELFETQPGIDRYPGLVDYIFEHVGLDPATYVRQSMIQAHATATGNPALGWIIAGSETADDILFKLSGSLNGLGPWHDRAGRFASQLLRPPSESGDVLVLDESRISGDIEMWDDDPANITDRVHAARNWFPLREGNTAGITTTFTEQDREDVIADYRVTRRAKFPELVGYPDTTFAATSIEPTSGDEGGGTEFTITGTGFRTADAATVTFGAEPATGVTVVNSTTITGTAPAGTGTVDVTVTQGDDSDTLLNAFEYTAAGYAGQVVLLNGTNHYPLNETSGTDALDSIGTADLAFSTSAGLIRDEPPLHKDGRSTQFGTSNAYLPCGSITPFSAFNRTYATWFKRIGTGEQRIIDWRDSSGFFFLRYTSAGDGTMYAQVGVSGSNTWTVNDDNAHLVVFSINATNGAKIYVDGAEVASIAGPLTEGESSGTARAIGRRRDQANSYYEGWMQGIAFFGYALSAQEANDLYQAGLT